MKKLIKGKEAINGSWGEMWFDGEYMAQVTAFKAEIGIKTTPVPRVQSLSPGQKMTGLEPKGEVKMTKINSFMMNKIRDCLDRGVMPIFKIVSNINDPDSTGNERIVVNDATFDKLVLADWENEKLGEESYSFTFTDYDVLDTIA